MKKTFVIILVVQFFLTSLFLIYAMVQKTQSDESMDRAMQNERKAVENKKEAIEAKRQLEECLNANPK